MARVDLNRVYFSTPTTGTGSMVVGSASTGYRLPAGAGGADGQRGRYLILDGADYEIGLYTLSSTATVVSRDVVDESVIAGVRGTTKLTLSGTATVQFIESARDYREARRALRTPAISQTLGGL